MALPVLSPMLATLGPLPADEDAWAYEIKWDGIRVLAYVEHHAVRLASRNGIDVTARYPELAALADAVNARDAILDGEIVAFDDDGLPRFERLQKRMGVTSSARIDALSREVPVALEIFDVLWLDGQSLLSDPYLQRRDRLAALDLDGEHWQTPAYQLGRGRELLAASRERGLEGILAKRPASIYQPGRRSRAWVKVKNSSRQELVIGGWLPGKGRRGNTVGALLVGYYDPTERDADGRPVLRYAGKVGTGFTEAELARLQGLLEPLAIGSSPFVGRQTPRGARFVRPELVAEIEFTEWTRDGMLRHPSYKGLRDDKAATDVVRETPSAQPPVDIGY
jgi:bifunctional non-homologous end joining protein LigD